jgi:large subunit ribosomal protein L4
MKAAALRGALSDRVRVGRVHVIERLVDGKPSTRSALLAIGAAVSGRSALVLLERSDAIAFKSLANAVDIHVLAVDQLNTYDVLIHDDVVFTKGALKAFLAGPPKGGSVKAVATESEAKDVEEAK